MEVMLKEIGEIITGNTPSKNIKEFWDSNDICFIKPDIIADFVLNEIYVSNEYISECARKRARIVSKGAVFVTCIGSIGKIGIAGEGEYAFNQQINAIVPNSKINPRYLAYNLLFNKQRLIAVSNAPVVPIINKSQFGEFVVNIEQDISKQSRIVYILDKLSLIINNRKEELNQLDIIIKARFVEMFGDLVVNPYKWTVVKLSEISLFLKSGLSRRLSDVDIGLPVIRSGNIQNGQFVYNDIKYWYKDDPQGANTEDYRLENGDILVNFINSASQIGKTAIFSEVNRECIYTTNILRMKLTDSCNVYYYNWFAMSDYYYRQLQNIIQPAVNQASFTTVNFLKLNIPLPPLQLQKQFETFVHQVNKSKFALKLLHSYIMIMM